MLNTKTELEILKARAAKLAEEDFSASEGKNTDDMLFFKLADENYAINLTYLKDVFQIKKITSVPCTPAYVKGILSVRGQIVSLLNLKALFNLPYSPTEKPRRALLLSTPEMQFAIAVDAVLGVNHIYLEDIQPPPTTLSGLKANYVQGVTASMTIVLNAEKMLSDQQLVFHEEVSE